MDVVYITGSKNTKAFTYDIGTNLRIPMRNIKTEEGSQHARFCAMAASEKNHIFTFAGLVSNRTLLPVFFNLMHVTDQSGQPLVACLF